MVKRKAKGYSVTLRRLVRVSRTNDAVQFRSLITSNDYVSLVIIFIIYA